ncbi:hypothetical protein THAOC_02962 [Thalassiosira oceanica]|uniref:MYND-type domain-containing protein n=1 Tax=Thalassiosira oceanica TaxID=159749 RepID=K0TD14_THAOC|nr:hypothetical protein THAOC_02962 [Thalassiosira oceanica]|eukprot:EJK75315.1 hypothetical protein THAOC_02962 [Thalassiosira oceanica]
MRVLVELHDELELPPGSWRGGAAAEEKGWKVCRHIKPSLSGDCLAARKDRNYPGFSVRSASRTWKTHPMSDETPNPSTGPKAGVEEERQKTEEERLLDEIAEQKDLIDALTGDTKDGIVHRASHEKRLGQLEFRYQLLVEKKRLARVLLKFQELHGDLYSEPCLICLDNIHVHASKNLLETFSCCGGFVCKSCALDVRESGVGLDKCPLCREFYHDKTVARRSAQLMALAKRGVSWAQSDVGQCMIKGMRGFEKQAQTGLEWINKAAAQNYPSALYELSSLYRDGISSELEKSEEKANELLLKSANLGHVPANSILSGFYFGGTNGFEKNLDEFYFRSSVTLALDNTREGAARVLGSLHFFEHGIPEPSLYLACYYLNIGVKGDRDGISSCLYGKSLLHFANRLHGNNITNGFNALPAAFFWLRKSRDMGRNDAREQLKEWETAGRSLCAYCAKKAETGEKFKQCSKCKAQWYCSKECQVEAWRAGHKKDCKRAAILKFEDYLNAE